MSRSRSNHRLSPGWCHRRFHFGTANFKNGTYIVYGKARGVRLLNFKRPIPFLGEQNLSTISYHLSSTLRHLHRHLEEPVGGVRRGVPRRIRQALLAPDWAVSE